MTVKEIMQKLETIKKGQYTPVCFVKRTIVNGKTYTKTTKMVVRFVDYNNMESTKQRRAKALAENKPIKASNGNVKHILKNLTYNINQDTYYVGMATTKSSRKNSQNDYDCEGATITKENYNEVVKPNPTKASDWLTKRVEDMVSIG